MFYVYLTDLVSAWWGEGRNPQFSMKKSIKRHSILLLKELKVVQLRVQQSPAQF